MKAAYHILAILLLLFTPVLARADAPVRTVVYHFAMDARGFGSAPSMGGGPYGGAVLENSDYGSSARSGTIRMDVVKATPDGGLVVDVSEHVDRELKDMQTVRCAVYGRSQSVICDQNLNATAEETVLLQYVGRFFYDPSRIDPAGRWHIDPHMTNATIQNTYTAAKTDGNVITVTIDRSEKAMSYRSHTEGTLLYDAALNIPESIRTATTTQRSSAQGDMNVELKLLTDSMAPTTSQTSH